MNNSTPLDFTNIVSTTANIAGQNIFGVIGAVLPFVLPVLAGLWGEDKIRPLIWKLMSNKFRYIGETPSILWDNTEAIPKGRVRRDYTRNTVKGEDIVRTTLNDKYVELSRNASVVRNNLTNWFATHLERLVYNPNHQREGSSYIYV